MNPLALIGSLVAIYVVVAIVRGEVFAKSGIWGRTIRRDDQPVEYWFTVTIYALLCVAMYVWS